MEKDLLPIGRVTQPHGVKGKIKVDYYSEDLQGFSSYREIFIRDGKGRAQTYEVLEVVPQPPRLIVQLKGIEKREEVESLLGREVLIRREDLPDLREGEYYWIQIVGMRVETEDGKEIGKVKEIFSTKANDVYIVGGRRREIFLPATDEVIREIDIEKGVMKVHRIGGLWEEEDEV